METYRYILQKGGKKQTCPACGKKCFVPYVDTETGSLLPEPHGRCDRETNCAYWPNPYQDGYTKMISDQERGGSTSWVPKPLGHTPPPAAVANPSYVPLEVFKKSRCRYEENNFAQWLAGVFGEEIASNLIGQYHIGTSRHWKGATVFWQIDGTGKIRSGKIMLYNAANGKRVKVPFNHITWAHKALNLAGYQLQQCYFGAHLLVNSNKPVALVESEKTAIIASVYLPKFTWLAAGSLSNINTEKCKVLAGRSVYLFPDLKGFDKWSAKAKELSAELPGTTFGVSDLLERIATEEERESGLDLADYLLRFDHKDFADCNCNTISVTPTVTPTQENAPTAKPAHDLTENKGVTPLQNETLRGTVTPRAALYAPKQREQWNLEDLERFFYGASLPSGPVQLYPWSKVTDPALFIQSHLAYLKANNGQRLALPHLERMERLRAILEGTAIDLTHTPLSHSAAA